ncbi:MAG: hypothetical protein B7Y41_14320 [Hydrogenophilales bacterium 28-61-23]|nr:MAG: hypothetical protein B7Y41_14320 [Hydrogenophilales bacterium 28-61-23]
MATEGKLVLLPFPFDDFRTAKVRPALCLTEPIGAYRHVIVAFISSRLPDAFLASDLLITRSHPEFASTGLKLDSVLKLHRLLTVPESLFQRELGTLPSILRSSVSDKLRTLFQLHL